MIGFPHIPPSFVCTAEDHRRYQSVRSELLPKLRQYAYLFFRYKSFGEEAQDVLQGLEMLAVWGVKVHDPTKGSLTNWIASLAHNAGIDYWRRNAGVSRKPSLILEDGSRTFCHSVVRIEEYEDSSSDVCDNEETLLAPSVEDEEIAEESAAACLGALQRRLSPFQQCIFEIIFGEPDEELAIFVRNYLGRKCDPMKYPLRLVAEFFDCQVADFRESKRQVLDVAREILGDLGMDSIALGDK
jgi:DNA-directed RNA polymerase specialized sigma24 family protein